MDSEARVVPDIPGYMVDNCGNVWSFKKKVPYILAIGLSEKGYAQIGLSKNNCRVSFRLHRLIAQVFLDTWDPALTVNHIDGNKLNNKVTNLEMCSQKDNILHARSLGLYSSRKGSGNPQSKLSIEEVGLIRTLLGKIAGNKIALMFGVTPTVISYINTGKTYKEDLIEE